MVTKKLTALEQKIIGQLNVFRVTTPDLAKRCFSSFETAQAAKNCLEKMRKKGLLQKGEMGPGTHFYFPSSATVSPETPDYSIPPTTQKLIEHYGIFLFCTAEPRRGKLTREQFAKFAPDLVIPKMNSGRFFYETTPKNELRLGFLRVDTGGNPYFVVQRLKKKFATYRNARAAWGPILDDGFGVAFITAFPEKEALFKIHMEAQLPKIMVYSATFPELFPHLTRA